MDFKDLTETARALSEPVNKLTVPLASSMGKTLQDVWELVFGGFDTFVEKKRLERLKAIDDFKASLNAKVAAIPESQLQEPKLSVVGPALEASKYYFEEKTMREMFANLIASSMDSSRSKDVHPSFTEAIKQMSPLDAQNLALFHEKSSNLPLAEYRLSAKSGFLLLQTHVFLSNPAESDIERQALSISSLIRLGLLTASYERHLTDKTAYLPFMQTSLYNQFQEEYGNTPDQKVDIQRGMAHLSPFGDSFCAVCLSDSV